MTRSLRPLRVATPVLAALALAACGDEPAPPPAATLDRPAFDGDRALELVERQVAFGPRVPGTEGHRRQLDWMVERLAGHADTVVADSFVHRHSSGDTLRLVNVLARFRPDAERRLLFLAHWDTRPTSDAAETPERRALPVPGANDGASGTAVLLEVARILAEARDAGGAVPSVGVDLLFVDGEDYGPTVEDMLLGARRFAATVAPDDRPAYGVLLDMVGDADPEFPIEGYSAEFAPEVAQRVWGVAGRLGYGHAFPVRVGQRLTDDHVPLNEAGIPTIDVIDFDYPAWHTPDDLPDRLSASTLDMVGELVLELAYLGG